MEKVSLQNVVFPTDEKMEYHHDLFYHGPKCMEWNGVYQIPYGFCLDFATYINGLPQNKWDQYTNVQNYGLSLEMKGKFRIILTGYHLEPDFPVRKVFISKEFECREYQSIELEFPENNEEMLAFEIEAISDCEIRSGEFVAYIEKENIREINLAVCTTTCYKEEYIKHNINSIKSEIMDSGDPMAEHFFVNIIDNGRSLKKEEVESKHIRLFPNKNVGGSGGFARGMIEAMHMKETEITHVLLMDDDVVVLTESIRRTYRLLKYVKDDYKNALISGAMMELDNMGTFHEDIGVVRKNKDFFHLKRICNVNFLDNMMRNNRKTPYYPHEYAGWWFCCIPMTVIKKNGLPLPLFLRGDDVEYGIRCSEYIMTMNGISVWHVGFANKFSASTNFYQEFRNMMIIRAATGNIPDVNIYSRWLSECYRAGLTYNYDGWELLILAMEEYLMGPSFIEEDRCVELLKRNKALDEKLVPLSETEGPGIIVDEIYGDEPGYINTKLRKLLYELTWNGQRFSDFGLMHHEIGVIGFDWTTQPGRSAFHDQIMVVNPFDRSGRIRKQDKQRFKELFARYKKVRKDYADRNAEVEKAYRERFSYLTSEEFWLKYLEI